MLLRIKHKNDDSIENIDMVTANKNTNMVTVCSHTNMGTGRNTDTDKEFYDKEE